MAGMWGRVKESPETTDRVLVGVCAGIWLVLLGVGVAALVALVDLGRGFDKTAGNPHTGLLYVIVGISALIILAAVPMLLHARRQPPPARAAGVPARRASGPPRRPVGSAPRGTLRDPAADRFQAPGPVNRVAQAAMDRMWLRGTTSLVSTIGAALLAVAGATYLMAVGKDVGAWVGYGLAGAFLVAMPVVLWVYLRRLRWLLARYRR